jgi:hypothetical protein
MSAALTTEQILALAPDAAAAKAGQGLSGPRKWVTLGRDERAVWGECQGSGKTPYQVQVDLASGELAYRCSCPSRKLPCKHTLGLLLLLAGQAAAIEQAAPPPWVSEWLDKRSQTAQKRERAVQPVDAAAQTKRAAAREARVASGLHELEERLADLVRQGLAQVQSKPASFWNEPAQRMWDAQARDVAFMIRDLADIPASGDGWQDRLLERLSLIYLLIAGYKRIEQLPAATQADLRDLIGWDQSKEEVLASAGVRDRWLVLGQYQGERARESLHYLRTWLRGAESGRDALIFEETHVSQPLPRSLVPGSAIDAELVFYPGAYPLRALLKTADAAPLPLDAFPGDTMVNDALGRYATALVQNPWVEAFPLSLCDVIAFPTDAGWLLRDCSGYVLPLAPRFEGAWHLLALGGGHPIGVFGEWNGEYLHPLAVWAEGRFFQC